jgi:1-acyl-sn-glycerol-3-phosphate acyltransferase
VLGAGQATDPHLHPLPQRPPLLYRLVVLLLHWLIPKLFRLQVEGLENIPPAPYILASNHQAWYDSIFLVAVFPRLPMIYTMAKRETVFNTWWKRAIAPRFGVFPISPHLGELDEQGIRSVYQVLDRGGVMSIFPEGRYSRGVNLRPLRKGVAHFALQAGVPICPVAISGLDRLRLRGVVKISIGPPIRPHPPRWWSTTRRVQRVLDSLRRGIVRAFGRRGLTEDEASRQLLWRLRNRIRGLLERDQRRRIGSRGVGPTSPPGR